MYKARGRAPKTLIVALLLLGLAACNNDTAVAEGSDTAIENETPVENTASAGTAKPTDFPAGPAPAPGTIEDFSAKLERARPGIKVIAAEDTPVEGVVRVDLEGAGSVYALKGTDYFVLGELYQIQNGSLVNISEQEKQGLRAELLAKMDAEDMIVFSPEGEVKSRISVFTDVDCGYCQKLHQEVPELNAMGIEVRYLAFPRAGIGSPSYNKIASAWCADDPRDAITKLKNRQKIPDNVCDGNPVASQYDIGGQMGVRGTPAILLEDGMLLPGYLPAAELAKRVGI